MIKYDVDGALKNYIQHMKIILKNLLLTYDNTPDIVWWNSIMTKPKYSGMCGRPTSLYISGWILNFFGLYGKKQ